jgi:putative nucleotidyltransferase with HDIG domain
VGLIALVALIGLWLGLDYLLFMGLRLWLPPLQPLALALASFGLALLVKVRFLAADWQVQRLSIDSVLFMGRLDFTDVTTTFPEYLTGNWPEIEKWSGVALLSPTISGSDREIQAALNRLPPPERLSGKNLEASIVHSRKGPNRLLLGLPDLENRVNQYTVLGWSGRKSPEALKSLAAMVLSGAMYFKALEEYRARQQLFMGLIRIIMGAVDAKEPFTAGHSNRVAELAKELAQKAGLPVEDVENVYLGGLLHDVGKLGIPEGILNKPGKLDEVEMVVMRSHPVIGSELMSQIRLPDIVMRSIYEHHERLDGAGYPNKLKSDQLSLAGKILKIADVFDALISRRQYKEAIPETEVYKILRAGVGTEFDEELINLIIQDPFKIKNIDSKLT